MKIAEITSFLESIAPLSLQESYDNAGLLTGNKDWDCHGIICTLDATPEVIEEAISKNINLVVAHHPIIFNGLKKINGNNYVERAIILAIKNDIAIYAIHTNLDNILTGVNGRIADLLGLVNRKILKPKENTLKKLLCFVPVDHLEKVRDALFETGAGHIGNYSDCSFSVAGTGSFRAGPGTNPFVGEAGKLHEEKETKLEVIFPSWLQTPLIQALKNTHPYEEVAYDLVDLSNTNPELGSGILGELGEPAEEQELLARVKSIFGVGALRHTAFIHRKIHRVAICGGAGSFLISSALKAGADVFLTADLKYHEFFDANGRMLLADIGHFESEQFTISLLYDVLKQKFPTFAVLKTAVNTNPVHYF